MNGENKMMEQARIHVQYSGKTSHAAAAPDYGRSAFDALLLAISGTERMQKYLTPEIVVSYRILSSRSLPCNVVPDHAAGDFQIVAKERDLCSWGVGRVRDILEGAAQMTGTACEIRDI